MSEKISPKHVFLHFFAIIMLYIATGNFLTLIFQYINLTIPDPLVTIDFFSESRSIDMIRYAIASILIVFPLFILTSWFLNKKYLRNPEIREMNLRKWLIYFTLFVAALIIVGSLIRIILVFLEGEATLKFILKALSVLIVSGVIFGYYLHDVKRNQPSKKVKGFVWTIIVIVAITTISGFFFIGSPTTERLRKFDQERINNLQYIQDQIIFYYQSKEELPQTLSDLEDEISGYSNPEDPKTGQNYQYSVKDDLTFELCANFSLDGEDYPTRYSPSHEIQKPTDQTWNHERGETCFERTIDPELYPPFEE
tara:strand:+ start:111 stop:1040 length:930 start_codon:yes stop_codon:yes gene_type:complete